jgi:glucose-6-phosphate 1-dehydrogenase
MFTGEHARNWYRLRIAPDMTIASGVNVPAANDDTPIQVEMLASHLPQKDEVEAYERVLGEAMLGDATHFAREDFVEEAWRIVEPALAAPLPVVEYDPKTWGAESEALTPAGGWHNPVVKG